MAIIKSEKLRGLLEQSALYLMLGSVIGFLFFYDIFPYFCAPFNSPLPAWALILSLVGIGLLAGYLYTDIVHVLASAVLFPLLGAFFCFIIFISPAFSPDILMTRMSDDFFILARLVMFDMFMTFIIIFTVGFISLYLFDPDNA
ncbi:MAG: hypothetical protein Q7J68_01615 [Thermoplasmata archaeon]|nr:hypothetical protein [Thermoplasmata archaeon]